MAGLMGKAGDCSRFGSFRMTGTRAFVFLACAFVCSLFVVSMLAGTSCAYAYASDTDPAEALQLGVIAQPDEDVDMSAQVEVTPATMVYHAVNSKSGIFHLSNKCSGIKTFESMTYAEAAARGYRACKVCAGGTATESASDTSSSGTTTSSRAMHRLYNPNSGEHFYTASENEKNGLVKAGWRYEGIGWTAPATSKTPVYRLYSGTDHHYTTSKSERDGLIKVGWKGEGIGWYSDDAKGVPLYRQFNPNVNPKARRNNSGSHNYTMSKSENDNLVKVGWRAEGVGWYGVK